MQLELADKTRKSDVRRNVSNRRPHDIRNADYSTELHTTTSSRSAEILAGLLFLQFFHVFHKPLNRISRPSKSRANFNNGNSVQFPGVMRPATPVWSQLHWGPASSICGGAFQGFSRWPDHVVGRFQRAQWIKCMILQYYISVYSIKWTQFSLGTENPRKMFLKSSPG